MSDEQQGVPPGMVETPVQQGLPPGMVETQVQQPAQPQAAQPDAQQDNTPGRTTFNKIVGLVAGPDAAAAESVIKPGQVAKGFAEGMGDTVSGISHLIHRIPGGVGEALAPQAGITALDQKDVPESTQELAGKGLEGIAEFATGDEALEGLSKAMKITALAKKYGSVAEVLNMAKDHPILAKMITGGSKAAAVGAAQGAVKGAQKENAVKGAEEGGVGGAIGGALAEPLAQAPAALARKTGVGGLDYVEALVKALRPNTKEASGGRFISSLEKAEPILKQLDTGDIKTVGDFEDAVHDKANDLWEQGIQPKVDKYANDPRAIIDGRGIATKIRKGVDDNVGMRDLFPEQVAPIENMAKHFDSSNLSIDKANGYLKTLNAQLKDYYRLSPEARNAMGMTSGRLSSIEDAADGIREQMYDKIDTLEGQPSGTEQQLRSQYGALKDIERVSGRRAVVHGREAPLNLAQQLGAMEGGAAILAGHPLAAAAAGLPWVAKARQASPSLIRQGIGAAAREGGAAPVSAALREGAKGLTRTLAPAVGAATGESLVPEGTPPPADGFIRVQDSAGGVHDIPEHVVAAASQRDPGLKILDDGKNASNYQQQKEFTPTPEDSKEFDEWRPTGPVQAPGMLKPGNIDLTKRPIVHHPDGKVSSLYSTSFNIDGKEVLVPQVSPDGHMMTEAEAEKAFINTGKHLGIFKDPASADKFAKMLHEKQGAFQTYKNGGSYKPVAETYEPMR